MKLAVLFWCYKELDLCVDRLDALREQDPDVPIYVLFGGEPADAEPWRQALSPFAQDFYVFEDGPPADMEDHPEKIRGGSFWKYMYGDWMIATWYRDRGISLEWDTIAVIQWDMLVYGKVTDAYSCLKQDQILLSGLRPVREVEDAWVWTTFPRDRARYDEFLAHIRERYDFDQEPKCFLAVVVAYPRIFLDKFSQIEKPALGFLEYRISMYAQAFNVPVCTEHPFNVWWGTDRYSLVSTLRARPREIWAPVIAWNRLKRSGARVFHPYWHKTPRGVVGWSQAFLTAGPRLILSGFNQAKKKLRARFAPTTQRY